jgi:hypothetical protein
MMQVYRSLRTVSAGVVLGVALLFGLHMPAYTASAQAFMLVNVEASGAIWLPSVIVVHPGDQVTAEAGE